MMGHLHVSSVEGCSRDLYMPALLLSDMPG